MQYLDSKLDLRQMQYVNIGLVAEKKRVEEYLLILPKEVDCMLEDSIHTSLAGVTGYEWTNIK